MGNNTVRDALLAAASRWRGNADRARGADDLPGHYVALAVADAFEREAAAWRETAEEATGQTATVQVEPLPEVSTWADQPVATLPEWPGDEADRDWTAAEQR